MSWSSACKRPRPCRRQEVDHVRHAHQFFPPPSGAPLDQLWLQLPAHNRQRVIWLFSRVLERHLLLVSNHGRKGDSDDRSITTRP